MVKFNVLLLVGLLFPLLANASSYDDDKNRDDQSIPVGGFLLTPTVKFKQGYDSNVTSAKENTISSWVTVFQPSLKATTEFEDRGSSRSD